MDIPAEPPLLLPSSPRELLHGNDDIFTRRYSETASAHSSTHGSDGIFDRRSLRSPINGSESEYEDEDDLISEMPTESATPSCYGGDAQDNGEHEFIQYTPSRKHRSPFRNPSSVRGMQLETTPPHLRSPTRESMSKRHQSRLSVGSRTSTPRSVRSYRSGSPTKTIVTPTAKKDSPLVLLHVTILPISCPYSQAVLEDVAPPHLLQNWKLLREKVPDTVLERGILIPHPREEYEMLEERLLESLELAVPKILKCGHYHGDQVDDGENELAYQQLSEESEDPANDSDADSDVCEDCTRHVRDGTKGSAGTGTRRWNICIYAANGLMRAGAWSAAWKEMERIDVEISPWMDDGLRHELDLKRAQEAEDHARRVAEEHEQEAMTRPSVGLDEERLREIYGTNLPPHHTDRNFTPGDFVAAYEHSPVNQEDEYLTHLNPIENKHPIQPQGVPHDTIHLAKRRPTPQRQQDISTSELLLNYVKLLLQDQRNVALALLSLVVLWLALRSAPASVSSDHPAVQPLASVQSSLESLVPISSAIQAGSLSSSIQSMPLELASSASSLWSSAVESIPTQLGNIVHGSMTESAELATSSA